jgi:MFS family permease
MTTLTLPRQPAQGMTRDERRVIFASSLGTVFEWYDFYLYATLAPFFAALFFPPGNDTAALLSAFATYAAGFLVRPFGALMTLLVGAVFLRDTKDVDIVSGSGVEAQVKT